MVSIRKKYEFRILKMNGIHGQDVISVTYSLSDKEYDNMYKRWKRFTKDALGEDKYFFTVSSF